MPSSPGTLHFLRRCNALMISTTNGLERALASGDNDALGIFYRISLSTGFSQLSTLKKCFAILLCLWDLLISWSTLFFTRNEEGAGLETRLRRRRKF